jgi:hypothetical protein
MALAGWSIGWLRRLRGLYAAAVVVGLAPAAFALENHDEGRSDLPRTTWFQRGRVGPGVELGTSVPGNVKWVSDNGACVLISQYDDDPIFQQHQWVTTSHWTEVRGTDPALHLYTAVKGQYTDEIVYSVAGQGPGNPLLAISIRGRRWVHDCSTGERKPGPTPIVTDDPLKPPVGSSHGTVVWLMPNQRSVGLWDWNSGRQAVVPVAGTVWRVYGANMAGAGRVILTDAEGKRPTGQLDVTLLSPADQAINHAFLLALSRVCTPDGTAAGSYTSDRSGTLFSCGGLPIAWLPTQFPTLVRLPVGVRVVRSTEDLKPHSGRTAIVFEDGVARSIAALDLQTGVAEVVFRSKLDFSTERSQDDSREIAVLESGPFLLAIDLVEGVGKLADRRVWAPSRRIKLRYREEIPLVDLKGGHWALAMVGRDPVAADTGRPAPYVRSAGCVAVPKSAKRWHLLDKGPWRLRCVGPADGTPAKGRAVESLRPVSGYRPPRIVEYEDGLESDGSYDWP